jgi:hypothetical protein
MADYGFNYNLGPQAKQTSLGDMLNMAGSAQALQQNMQMNPLQVQQAQELLRQNQLATQKAEALNPQEIATGRVKLQEEEKQAPITTKEKQFDYFKKNSDRAFQIMTGFLRDPAIINAASNPDGVGQVLDQMNKLLLNGGVDESIAKLHMNELMNVAQKHPDKLVNVLQNIGTAATTSEAQQGRRTPQLTNAGTLYTAESGTVGAPTIVQPPALQTPPPNQTEQNNGGRKYLKRGVNDPRPYAPGEAKDEEEGRAYAAKLAARQSEMTTSKRNLDEVIKEATKLNPDSVWSSGFLGMVNRKFKDFVGDPTYKQLSKDLANVQIANIQAMGGSLDTVAGQQLSKMANGDETYPPSVLINIARRSYADLTDLDMRATAADKYAQNHGIANMNTFKQLWAANSDSKLFEAIAIEKSNLSPEQKKKEFKALIGNDPAVLKDLMQKKKNLEKLTATGDL